MSLYGAYQSQVNEGLIELGSKLGSQSRQFLFNSIAKPHPQATDELDRLKTAEGADSTHFPQSFLIAFVFMNVLNHLDDACETRSSTINPSNLSNHEVMTGVSLTALLAFLSEATKVTNTPKPSIIRLNEMIEAQQHGMTLVAQSKQVGKIVYSLDQAIQYRTRTLGNYFSLIAELGLTDRAKQLNFAREMMSQQKTDDRRDVFIDHYTQVNPYVAILYRYGLIKKVIDKTILFDTVVYHKEILQNQKLSDALWKDEQSISDAYQSIQ